MTIDRFALDLERFAKKASRQADLVVRKVVFDVGNALVFKTPVGDADYWIRPAPSGYVGGRARGNWQYGLNAPDLSQGTIDGGGAQPLGRIVSKTPTKAAGQVHYITNTLPYIKRLEDGWSKRQAPKGMVKLTIREFKPIVDAAARALN